MKILLQNKQWNGRIQEQNEIASENGKNKENESHHVLHRSQQGRTNNNNNNTAMHNASHEGRSSTASNTPEQQQNNGIAMEWDTNIIEQWNNSTSLVSNSTIRDEQNNKQRNTTMTIIECRITRKCNNKWRRNVSPNNSQKYVSTTKPEPTVISSSRENIKHWMWTDNTNNNVGTMVRTHQITM